MPQPTSVPPPAAVDLYRLPLAVGPGGAVVRRSGRLYEWFAARRRRRPRRDRRTPDPG